MKMICTITQVQTKELVIDVPPSYSLEEIANAARNASQEDQSAWKITPVILTNLRLEPGDAG